MVAESAVPVMGETVVCKVTRVLDYGAFVELVEFNNVKGFIHISQISNAWVKNIRNHVREGQIRATKVLSFNQEKGQIDLSLTKVSSEAQRIRIEEWKQLKRAKKLIELLAQGEKTGFEEAWDAIALPLLAEYDSLPFALQQIAAEGEQAAQSIAPKWRQPLVSLVQKSITVPERIVSGKIELHSLQPNGVELIKNALLQGIDAAAKGSIELFYVKSGKYEIRAKGHDFKAAEKRLNSVANAITQSAKEKGFEAKFEAA